MSLLNKASLIQIPSGYKDGTLYSAKPTNGDGDFTFSRGSNLAATRVNSEGLIEKGRENLILQSNSFDTTWTTANASVTSGQVGYDGSSDAWLLTDDAVNGSHDVRQSISIGGLKTISVYAKAGTLNFLKVYSGASLTYFNLSTGEVGTNGHSGAYMEDVGGGWYRCSLFDTATFTFALFGVTNANNVASYSGTGSGSIYIQDAQLEQGLVATDYIETTTTTAQAGILEDMPRLDYAGGASCPSLLLEPQRSNLIPQSEYIGHSSWVKTDVVVTDNETTSPDGSVNASSLTTNNASGSVYRVYNGTTGGTDASNAISAFFKYENHPYVFIVADSAGFSKFAIFNVQDGTIEFTSSGYTSTIEPYSNGWYRCTLTGTIDSTNNIQFGLTGSTSNYAGTSLANGKKIYFWGTQREYNVSYPTSYIPTYGSSVTRSADDCIKTGISSLIGQTEGTMFIDTEVGDATNEVYGWLQASLSGNPNDSIQINKSSSSVQCQIYNGASLTALISGGSISAGQRIKIALGYKQNDIVLYLNGTQIGTDTSTNIPTCALFQIGTYPPLPNNYTNNGGIKQALLFKTRLTNDELADLTTL